MNKDIKYGLDIAKRGDIVVCIKKLDNYYFNNRNIIFNLNDEYIYYGAVFTGQSNFVYLKILKNLDIIPLDIIPVPKDIFFTTFSFRTELRKSKLNKLSSLPPK